VTTRELIAELAGTVCRCGSTKVARQTFCKRCYYRLPEFLRRALYRRVGQGYEQAYAQAAKMLDTPEASQ